MEQEEKKVTKKKGNGLRLILHISLFLAIFLIVWLISKYVFHSSYIWLKSDAVNPKSFWNRQIINIIILLIIFAILYFTRIYELINNFIGGVFSDKEEKKRYNKTKLMVWLVILGLLYFFIVPKAIDLTNSISSFVINIGKFFIHLIPILLISIALYFAILFGIKHWKKQKENETTALDLEKDINETLEKDVIENKDIDSGGGNQEIEGISIEKKGELL